MSIIIIIIVIIINFFSILTAFMLELGHEYSYLICTDFFTDTHWLSSFSSQASIWEGRVGGYNIGSV